MSYPATVRREMLSAGKRLAKRETAMRTALNSHQPLPACATACVAFFKEAVNLRYSDGVEELADLLDDNDIEHNLGTRTFDMVFESGAISDAVVIELVRLFDEDPAFRDAMTEQGWDTSVDLWRDTAPPFNPEPLPAAPAALLALPYFPSSPQGDLFAAYL